MFPEKHLLYEAVCVCVCNGGAFRLRVRILVSTDHLSHAAPTRTEGTEKEI
jgi:hypothetical protein